MFNPNFKVTNLAGDFIGCCSRSRILGFDVYSQVKFGVFMAWRDVVMWAGKGGGSLMERESGGS